jgi:hypothetical protein
MVLKVRWLFSFCFSFTDFQLETVSKAFHITVLQISEGTNSVGIVRLDLGFWLGAVMRSPYFFVLIFN